LATRTLQHNAARLLRDFAIDRSVIKRASKIVKAALSGGSALTRAELYEQLDSTVSNYDGSVTRRSVTGNFRGWQRE